MAAAGGDTAELLRRCQITIDEAAGAAAALSPNGQTNIDAGNGAAAMHRRAANRRPVAIQFLPSQGALLSSAALQRRPSPTVFRTEFGFCAVLIQFLTPAGLPPAFPLHPYATMYECADDSTPHAGEAPTCVFLTSSACCLTPAPARAHCLHGLFASYPPATAFHHDLPAGFYFLTPDDLQGLLDLVRPCMIPSFALL